LHTLPSSTVEVLHSLRHFIVERARTARRYISSTKPDFRIDELNIIEFDKDNTSLKEAMAWLKSGVSVGIISESGMPGIADPGADLVKLAHISGINVIPLPGPSSILLALSASGLNGQSFTFRGYLPIKEGELKSKLNYIQQFIKNENQTQIFIETPYRNDRLFSVLIKHIDPQIKLCVARDLSGEHQLILTKEIRNWRKLTNFKIEKYPAIFLLGK